MVAAPIAGRLVARFGTKVLVVAGHGDRRAGVWFVRVDR